MVSEVITDSVITCSATELATTALETLGKYKIRRLPVVNKSGELEGIISLNDLILAASNSRTRKKGTPNHKEVVETFQYIAEHYADTKAA